MNKKSLPAFMSMALVTATTGSGAVANVLATKDQLALEKLSMIVAESQPVRAARESARRHLLSDETARTIDGAAGLDRALDQWVMGQINATINNDPSQPRLFWSVDNSPRFWFGQLYPGAAVAIDNPDNINRTTAIDGDSSYILEGQFGDPATAQMSINVTLAGDGQLRWGDAVATLTNLDIEADKNGRFTLTLDKSPANGRKNHIQLQAGPLTLAIRDSHSDWAQQPTAFTIKVLNSPAAQVEKSQQALIEESAAGVEAFVLYWLNFKNSFWDTPPHNQMIGPNFRKREGGWGTQAGGRFKLADDEALLITTTSGGAHYTGFQISDPWTISPTPVYQTTSRNLTQITANPDGSYSYVVSLVDPGTANWIDTAGLHEGWFMLRWQNLPADVDGDKLVRSVQHIKLDALEKSLPKGSPRVSLQQRREEIQLRMQQHKARSAEQ